MNTVPLLDSPEHTNEDAGGGQEAEFQGDGEEGVHGEDGGGDGREEGEADQQGGAFDGAGAMMVVSILEGKEGKKTMVNDLQ